MTAFRHIPSIDAVLQRHDVAPLVDQHGREAVTQAARAAADALRATLAGDPDAAATIDAAAAWMARRIGDALAARVAASLRRVINATGVIVHTNLGRAPLAAEALARLATTAGYTNLEYDLAHGARGHRHVHAERLLWLTGARRDRRQQQRHRRCSCWRPWQLGREVIVSRGELVEIGAASACRT